MNIKMVVKSLLKGGARGLLLTLTLAALSGVVSAQNGGGDAFVADKVLARVQAGPAKAEFVPDEVLVRFRPGFAKANVDAVRGQLGAAEIKVIPRIDVHHWRVPQGVEKALERLLKNPNVEYAEPNLRWSYSGYVGDLANPGDPSFTLRPGWPSELGYQEYLNHDVFHADPNVREIHAEEAWDNSPMGAGAIVAVIDSGVDMDHPDLDGNLLRGKNLMLPGNRPPVDDFGHGTHVAGIIAAEISNFGDTLVNTAALDSLLGDGVVGVAPMAKIMPIKVGDASGIPIANVAEGIIYAADHGAHIANLSLGGSYSQTVQDAMNYAYLQKDMLIIAAAGNSNLDNANLHPAAGAYSLSVAAVDSSDKKAYFSNYGYDVDISAPGVNILSTLIDDDASEGYSGAYGRMSGTSMATPMVAGIAALIKSQYPSFGAEKLGAQILNTAFNIDTENPTLIARLGAGRIDAAQAVAAEAPPSVLVALVSRSESRDLLFQLKFSHVMNAAGQGQSGYDNSILNPLNYLLVHAGPDGVFGGEPSDDEVIPLSIDPATNYEAFPGKGITLAAIDAPGGAYQFYVPFDGVQTAAGSNLGTDSFSEFSWERPPFAVETVVEGDIRFYSLSLGPDHFPAIAFTDEASGKSIVYGKLMYGKWDGAHWNVEQVSSEIAWGIDLQFNPVSGEPCIAYTPPYDNGLYLAKKRDTGVWDIESVDTEALAYHIKVCFDPSGNPAIAYRKGIDGWIKLLFAYFDGSSWNHEIVGPAYTIGSLAWDPLNFRFAICASLTGTDGLVYYTRAGSDSWTSETVYAGENPRESCLDFDPMTGYPCIASAGDLGSNRGRFSRYDGSTWTTEDFTPEDTTTEMNGVRFAYNSSGTPYIAYDSKYQMHVTFWDGSAWKHHTIDEGDDFDPSLLHGIAIHPIDQVPIVLYGAGQGASGAYTKARLKLATYISSNATPEVTISSPANDGDYPDGDTVPIDFAGLASDAEDGDLTANLTWESNLDGTIGSGGSFSTTLSVGYHTITASATDSGGKAGFASVNITVGDPAPAAPTGLIAAGGDGFVDLDWSDNVEGDLAGYNVYRSTTPADPSPVLIASSVATSDYLDTDVVNGTTYYYVVTAVDQGANESPASNEVSATPQPDLPPAAPTGLTATGGFGVVNLDWNDNTETDLAGYNVYRSTTPGGSYAQIASLVPNSDYADSAVVGGTTYYYVVTAVDAVSQESGSSNEASATPSALPTLHVESITMALVQAGKNYKGEATVLVRDGSGAAVQGATVVGNWLFNGNLLNSGLSGVTDTAGNTAIISSPTKAKSGDTFTFVVTDVVLSGYVYAPNQNGETQDSIVVP